MWTWSFEDFSIALPASHPLLWRLERRAPEALAWRDDGTTYWLEGPLRGFRKREITIEVRDGTLEVRAERLPGFWTKERRSFRHVVTLPSGADASAIDARFAGGELSICIPKLPHARRRVIPVRVNGALPAPPRAELARPALLSFSSWRRLVTAARRRAAVLGARLA